MIPYQILSSAANSDTYAQYNNLNIEGGKVANAYGGGAFTGGSYSPYASNNIIVISGDADVTNVYGGYAATTNSDALTYTQNNSIFITGGTVGVVYGGFCDGGYSDASYNNITISGGEITGSVY